MTSLPPFILEELISLASVLEGPWSLANLVGALICSFWIILGGEEDRVASWSRQGDGSVCYKLPGSSAKGKLICGIPKCHFVGSQHSTLTHSRCC